MATNFSATQHSKVANSQQVTMHVLMQICMRFVVISMGVGAMINGWNSASLINWQYALIDKLGVGQLIQYLFLIVKS